MIDWHRGGCTGSIRRLVRGEVRDHIHGNLSARRNRYSLAHRILRRFFSFGAFGKYLLFYIILDLVLVALEAVSSLFPQHGLPVWATHGFPPDTASRELLLSVSGYFLAAQAGALGIVTLALALVTLIAQGENSDTDIRVYYHESMAFQVVASSVALLAILSVQLLWPFQLVLHQFGLGSKNPLFEYVMLGLHLLWLLTNLAAIAYFIDTTFRFVQLSERERIRERYTANILFPLDLTQRLQEHYYAYATNDVGGFRYNQHNCKPSAMFGHEGVGNFDVELKSKFSGATSLQDVRMIPVRWVLRRWSLRCRRAEQESKYSMESVNELGPQICFTPHMGLTMHGTVEWCRRRGGVPLTCMEKCVLRWSFVFGRANGEE
ncbi:MAG: hypothetical protein OXF56_22760 [Rhodobacteraceae bacterium]|nr:hypothetical protein [Paracoccaceae bacterium]